MSIRHTNHLPVVKVTPRTERILSVYVRGESNKIFLIRRAANRAALGYCAQLNRHEDLNFIAREIGSIRNNNGRTTEMTFDFILEVSSN